MSNALANVYSFGNKLRNNLKALLTDPANHLASQANIWAADMNRALDSPATAYRRAGGVMADDPSTVAAANREQERMTAALMGTAPGFVGMTAWHGSPHRFDRFDSSKIGTGEGAQVYGHGLYLAESPAVGRSYQEALSSTGAAQRTVAQNAGNLDAALAEAQGSVAHYQALIANGGGGDPRRAQGMLAIAQKKLDDIQRMKAGLPEETGFLYKVDLPDEMVARMLDWDKPLSQQGAVGEKLVRLYQNRAGENSGFRWMPPAASKFSGDDLVVDHLTGEEVYKDLLSRFYNRQKASAPVSFGGGIMDQAKGDPFAANYLRRIGVPGIRYLDQGSRGTGSGTSNFVIFPGEENALRILERNGMTLADMAGQSGKIDSRLLAALGLGSAAAVAGNALLNSGKKKMEDARKARQQAIEKTEEK